MSQSKGKISVVQKKRKRDVNKVVKKPVETSSEGSQNEMSSEDDEVEVENDELDLEQVSSDEGAESEVDNEASDEESSDEGDDISKKEDDDDFPKKKKAKMSKHDDGSNDFAGAVNAILSSHLKAYDRKDPIMARNKKVLKKNDSDKLEFKAKKAIVAEKKKLLNKARKKDIIPIVSGEDASGEGIRLILEKESKLRKIAQKGVVKLFNAILSTQVKTDKEVSENLGGIRNREERKELITEVSKEKFLDLVKAAGDDDE